MRAATPMPMKKRTFLIFSLVPVLLLSVVVAFAASFTGKVVRVSDGDTIQVMHNGMAEKIRLHGIDCPEKNQAYGQKAKEFTASLVAGQTVRVEVKDRDRYGRTVGRVFLPDGHCLNEELVNVGYAWHYKQYSNDSTLAQLEIDARRASRGLWKDPHPVAPWDWRAGKKTSSSFNSRKGQVNTPQVVSGGPVHGNVKSRVYHRSSCKDYNCKNCIAVFGSEREAQKAGYRPCKRCY